MNGAVALFVAALLLMSAAPLRAQQSQMPSVQPFAPRENIAAPVVLCIDDKPNGGGRPSAQAYAKAGANGARRSAAAKKTARKNLPKAPRPVAPRAS